MSVALARCILRTVPICKIFWKEKNQLRQNLSKTAGEFVALEGEYAWSRFRVYVPSTRICLGTAVAYGERSQRALVQSAFSSSALSA